ncbi:hypothetical protein D3C85_1475840 [compost metagenome]
MAGVVLLLALAAPHPSVSLPTHGMLERIASHLAGREEPYRRGEWHDGQGRHEARQGRAAALTGDAARCVRHQTDPPARQHDDT